MLFLFKLNTKQNNKRMNENKTVPSGAETQNRKQLPTNHSGKTGCLSMVLNQRQRLTTASDWEPYQAKHIEL
jgi:hypothetical protein